MKYTVLLLILPILAVSCIGDDIIYDEVEPEIRISNPVDTIELGKNHIFRYAYFNNVGEQEMIDAEWSSSDPGIISITAEGVAEGLALGSSEISIHYDGGVSPVEDSKIVYVGDTTVMSNPERTGSLESTSSYLLTGDFTLSEDGSGGLLLSLAANYEASSALPGLYVYMTNNPNTNAGANEIGPVEVFQGAHSYTIPDAGINDYSYVLYYCKPFNVKVGHGEIN